MSRESEAEGEETPFRSVVATLVTSGTLITAFALLAAGVWWFWVIFIVGFAGVLPAAVKLAEWHESRSEAASGTENDPLESLRARYANGEIDEAEFERRVERLLETESETEAEQFYGGDGRPSEPASDGESRTVSGSSRETESTSPDREFEREPDRN
jgi:uncharacterized membrane protein